MAQAKKDDPSTPFWQHAHMSPAWAMIDALLAGTDAMRAAGETYLPQHAEESDDAYDDRLQSAVLLNRTEQTLENLVSRPFCEPVQLGPDVPDALKAVLEDVDLQGNNLDVFARRWFREGLAKARSHVLVEFPRVLEPADGRPRTLADDRRDGLRPYWVAVRPENLLAAYAEVRRGKEVLTHVRIYECETVRQGYEEADDVRVRELNLVEEPGRDPYVAVTIHRKDAHGNWVGTPDGVMEVPYIPLVTFYADRKAFMLGKPPLLDLAHLNVAHWQSGADQRHCLTVARFPILACSGVSQTEADNITIGPNTYLATSDAQGKFYYVEHTGAALEAGKADLDDLDAQMASYGAEFLRKRPGSETATARALDSAEAVSPLQAMVLAFEDAVELALLYTAVWMRLDGGGGSVALDTSSAIEDEDPSAVQAITDARKLRDISREAYLEELKRRGILSEDFDIEADAERLAEEAPPEVAGMVDDGTGDALQAGA